MVTNHYPMTYGHPQAWAVLVAIILIGAWARHFFNLRHKGITKPSILISAGFGLAALAWVVAPKPPTLADTNAQAISDEQVLAIVNTHCTACHADKNTDPMFTVAQAGVKLETIAQIKQWAPRIEARAVNSHDMPMMNKTNMTEAERQKLGQWIQQQR